MDPISHIFITRKIIGTNKVCLVAAIIADLPFYATYPVWLFRQGKMLDAIKDNRWPDAPPWMQQLHHVFHSLPVVLGIITLFRLKTSLWPRWGSAWILHI